ncbi:MAG: tripartite tricarboxylate transporter permease [Bacillaceae bacterium]|nr:tripartite tricarboxylate transporter permease [Bacillaceae bacterium]
MLETLPVILDALANPVHILFMVLGVMGGIVVGALPGLTATMALALLLPFTFSMNAESALITLGGLYIGGIYGGCISAILINTPGTPSSIATTFDGYPLTRQGKPDQALVTAAISSGIGGLLGGFALLYLTPLLAEWALRFGPPEYFWISMLGLTMIASLSAGSMLKGLIGGAFGLLLSTIGIAPIGGETRYTFGSSAMLAGLELIVVLIAFFCIPEVISMVEKQVEAGGAAHFKPQKGVIRFIFNRLIRKPVLLARSAIIGIITGIIPGAGGNVASLLSYDSAVRFSRNRSSFGKGNIDGVAASECANNAEVGGSLVPLLSLGIPGAPPAAVILGALMMQGIQPGPDLFTGHSDLVYTFLWAFIVANVVMLILGLVGSRFVGRIINLPPYILAPAIAFLTVIGSYAIRNSLFDVAVMIGLGILAYFTKKFGFSPGPVVLGLILGPIAEKGLAQSILLGQAQGNIWMMFFSRPVSLVLIALCLLSLFTPLVSARFQRKIRQDSDSVDK